MSSTIRKALNAHRQAIILSQRSMQGVLLGQGYIVTSDSGTPLGFHTKREDGVTRVTDAYHCGHEKWSMFTQKDAENVAASTFDGHGKPGRAIHINDYLKEALEMVDKCLDSLDAPATH